VPSQQPHSNKVIITLDSVIVIDVSISVLQAVMDFIKSEPNANSDMSHKSSESGSQLIYVKQEEPPPFMLYQIKTEREVSSVSTCPFLSIQFSSWY
jgi:hypothetical protein